MTKQELKDRAFKDALDKFDFDLVLKSQEFLGMRAKLKTKEDMIAWIERLWGEIRTSPDCHNRCSSGCFVVCYHEWETAADVSIDYYVEHNYGYFNYREIDNDEDNNS